MTTTEREPLEDLAAAVERLIRMHQAMRAPTVAQVLSSCREARAVRIDRADRERILPAATFEQAIAEDFQRIRELASYGIFWDLQLGVFREMTSADLARLPRPSDPEPAERKPFRPCHRSDVNAAWLTLDRSKSRRGFGWLEREMEGPF